MLFSKRRSSIPPSPSISLHNSSVVLAQRINCLFLARRHIDASARKVKVKKRYQQDGSGTDVKVYSARIVAGEGPEERLLAKDWRFHGSEEEAVRMLSVIVVEEWREKQGLNFI